MMIGEEVITLSVPRMTDEEFVEFCNRYLGCFVEVTAGRAAPITLPNFTLVAVRGAKAIRALGNWADQDGTGTATEASGAFVLPCGARRSPDAAGTSADRLATQTTSDLKMFWLPCPEFVIELRSTHDRLPTLRAKMREWIDNGAQLAWMIDPATKTVEIYRPGTPVETLVNADSIVAGRPVAGFQLNLAKIWDPPKSH